MYIISKVCEPQNENCMCCTKLCELTNENCIIDKQLYVYYIKAM